MAGKVLTEKRSTANILQSRRSVLGSGRGRKAKSRRPHMHGKVRIVPIHN